MACALWYWPTIQGRGAFVRLALDAAGLDYEDRAPMHGAGARGGGTGRGHGAEVMVADMAARGGRGPLAPPCLDIDGPVVARVAGLPGIGAHLKSDRRIAFNEDGIFRHYPELDAPE